MVQLLFTRRFTLAEIHRLVSDATGVEDLEVYDADEYFGMDPLPLAARVALRHGEDPGAMFPYQIECWGFADAGWSTTYRLAEAISRQTGCLVLTCASGLDLLLHPATWQFAGSPYWCALWSGGHPFLACDIEMDGRDDRPGFLTVYGPLFAPSSAATASDIASSSE